MESNNSDDWVDPEVAERILEQERNGEWSEPMTAEELLAKIDRIGKSVH